MTYVPQAGICNTNSKPMAVVQVNHFHNRSCKIGLMAFHLTIRVTTESAVAEVFNHLSDELVCPDIHEECDSTLRDIFYINEKL